MGALATARTPAVAGGADSGPWTDHAEPAAGWFVATVSLLFAGNLWLSRYLWQDAFFDLSAGRYIAGHGLPHQNVFTVASHGASWVDQQWLAHLIFYGAWAAGGYPALVVLSSALVTGGYAVLALAMLRRGVRPERMLLWTLASFLVAVGNTEVRAQSFGYLFLALMLWLLAEDSLARSPRRITWLVLAVLVLWANTYGTVLIGAGLVVLYGGYRACAALARRDGRALRAYVAFALLAAGSPLCTPYGLAVIGYYRRFVASPLVARYDHEWSPPPLASPWCWAFYAMIVATAVALAVAWRRGIRPDPVLAGLAAVLAVVGLRIYKDLPWFGFAGALLAADTLARASAGRVAATGAGFRRAIAGVLAVLAAVSMAAVATTPGRVFEHWVPWRAIDVAAQIAGQHGRVLSDVGTGSELLGLHPELLGRVGFDIRLEQYTAAELSALRDFELASGAHWFRLTRGYDVIVVARIVYARLAAALVRLPGWHLAYADRSGIVVTRRVP